MSLQFTLKEAEELVDFFGGDDTEVTVFYTEDGHSGKGLYVYCSDLPEEGSDFLGTGELP